MAWYTVRHAHSEGQANPRAYKTIGDRKLPITPFGHIQSQATGVSLSDYAEEDGIDGFDIVHSTCLRATQTAYGIAEGLGPKLVRSISADRRIDKQDFGDFNGLFTDAERKAQTPEGFRAYAEQLTASGLFMARPPGGESLADVDTRTADFIAERRGDFQNNLVVVTHGTNALCVERLLLRLPTRWLLQRMDTVENCRVTRLELQPTGRERSELIYSPSGFYHGRTDKTAKLLA